jgi:hypothetical protein
MARGLGAVHAEELAGLEPVDDPAGYRYHFEAGANGPRVVETCPGVPAHRLEAELAYAIGAGLLDRAFVAVRGAFEWFAPLEIVSTPEGRHAALAPGHMASPGLRFGVAITPECLACHTDRLPPDAFPLNLHAGERWTPRGISCAACHGRTDEHERLRRTERSPGPEDSGTPLPGRDPVLRPAELSRTQRMSICAACHLQGDARIALDGSLAIPAPGGDLLQQRAVFVARAESEEIGFVSQTERLVLSACYRDASLACDTCHDPHRTLFEADERARVRNACQACHPGELELPSATASPCSRPTEPAAGARDCVDCHMRRTPTYDVAEVEIHDHHIRRDPGPASRPARPRVLASPALDWKRFAWPDQEPPEHVDDPGLWLMALAHRGGLERAAERLAEQPGPRVEGLAMYHHSRGSLLERIGRPEEAVPAYERALELDPELAPSAINLGLLYGMRGERERGIALLTAVLARHPAAVNALRNRAGLRFEAGDPAGFQADLTAAFELQPLAELAEILADFGASRGSAALGGLAGARARARAARSPGRSLSRHSRPRRLPDLEAHCAHFEGRLLAIAPGRARQVELEQAGSGQAGERRRGESPRRERHAGDPVQQGQPPGAEPEQRQRACRGRGLQPALRRPAAAAAEVAGRDGGALHLAPVGSGAVVIRIRRRARAAAASDEPGAHPARPWGSEAAIAARL